MLLMRYVWYIIMESILSLLMPTFVATSQDDGDGSMQNVTTIHAFPIATDTHPIDPNALVSQWKYVPFIATSANEFIMTAATVCVCVSIGHKYAYIHFVD